MGETEPGRAFWLSSLPGFSRVEFHREALALAPRPDDDTPGTALLRPGVDGEPEVRTCSCKQYKRRTCKHILELSALYSSFLKLNRGRSPDSLFRASNWFELASVLGDNCRLTASELAAESGGNWDRYYLRQNGQGRLEAIRYFNDGPDVLRLAGRLGLLRLEGESLNRSAVIDQLYLMTLSDNEHFMRKKGAKTFRMLLEESFYFRLAYHGFCEFGPYGISLFPAVDEASGEFTVTIRQDDSGAGLFRLTTPRDKVRSLLKKLGHLLENQEGLTIHPIPLKSIFKVGLNTELDLEVRPMIEMIQAGGEKLFFESEDFQRYRYGDLVYVKPLGILAELEKQHGRTRRFSAPVKMTLKKSQIPSFLEEHGHELTESDFVVDEEVEKLKILTVFDRLEINPLTLERDWCWLDVRYGFGRSSISLAEVLQARESGQRYLMVRDGWVDCQAEAFEDLEAMARVSPDDPGRVGLSRLDVLRLGAMNPGGLAIGGNDEKSDYLKKLISLKPAGPAGTMAGLVSNLRSYQSIGLEWLRFLYENTLGGLLCDDMGLGKTHQAMALMVSVLEADPQGTVLVACPTVVLSHWLDKINRFAPGLKAAVHHGSGRDLDGLGVANNVVITSYGILRQDLDELNQKKWSLSVFDEIQHLKNPRTKSYEAARTLQAGVKLGLTGTPIENRLDELKALFDLVLPGYLGSDRKFKENYASIETSRSTPGRLDQLKRLISPFILRRLKSTVLDELPEKIEDIATCRLSEDQVKLYREAINSRGKGLIDEMRLGSKSVPYIHIFALLGLLKQICDHPVLVTGKWEDYDSLASGKWELFKEILDESLAGEAKVVVYSQYLNMIKIISRHLESSGVGHVTLTGQSRKRGEIISRFDRDPDCRVFVGSLKAGGVGIDLVSASVVIHYDRWWNAAREDQATDRVHRIGQRRGVQVFKLVTLGTLEEKISAIVSKKRALMDEVIAEDDPGILKSCNTEELIDLLSFSP